MSARGMKSVLLIGVVLALAACGTTTSTPEAPQPTATETPQPTSTPTPTPTPRTDWMAWAFSTASNPYSNVLPCPTCNAGKAPLARGARVLHVDEEGIVWAAHVSDGLKVWDPRTGSVEEYDQDDGLLDEGVYDIARAPDGTLWLATYEGANMYQEGVFKEGLTNDTGLVGNTTWDLWIDSSGTIWVDTSNGYVLTAYDGESLTHYSDASISASYADWYDIAAVFPQWTQVNSMAEAPDGSLWFGTNGNGLLHYDGIEWRIYDEADGLATGSVSAVAVDRDGRVWMDVIEGDLTTFDGETFASIDPETFGYDWTIYPSAIWVGGSMVVLRYADDVWEYWEETGGLEVQGVEELVIGEDGSVWVSSTAGLARYGPVFDPAGE